MREEQQQDSSSGWCAPHDAQQQRQSLTKRRTLARTKCRAQGPVARGAGTSTAVPAAVGVSGAAAVTQFLLANSYLNGTSGMDTSPGSGGGGSAAGSHYASHYSPHHGGGAPVSASSSTGVATAPASPLGNSPSPQQSQPPPTVATPSSSSTSQQQQQLPSPSSHLHHHLQAAHHAAQLPPSSHLHNHHLPPPPPSHHQQSHHQPTHHHQHHHHTQQQQQHHHHQHHQQQHHQQQQQQHQQFCLKWNSFGSNLASSFSSLFKSETLADVTLFCEGVSFRAHKLILAACSKHLADLFEMAPLHQNLLVILDGTSADNMAALLEFMYKGEVHVSQDALSSFLKAAECLQVKGLSIEHEKLAVAHSQQQQQAHQSAMDTSDGDRMSSRRSPTPIGGVSSNSGGAASSSSSIANGKSIKMEAPLSLPPPEVSSPPPPPSPSMCSPHHYTSSGYASSRRESLYERRILRSPSGLQERPSVLRDCSSSSGGTPGGCGGSGGGKGVIGSSRPTSPGPMSLAYRPSSSAGSIPSSDNDAVIDSSRFDPDQAPTSLICPSDTPDHCSQDPGCPEDLRIKLEPPSMVVAEPASSTANSTNNNLSSSASANGSLVASMSSIYDLAAAVEESKKNSSSGTGPGTPDATRPTDIAMWNSLSGKLSKSGAITTPDGKKLKCPFCERLYGYETNLRAHIRQRHQGIRVPCPFCSRTFTRNNTVRRHIAREHKTELSLKAFQQVHNP